MAEAVGAQSEQALQARTARKQQDSIVLHSLQLGIEVRVAEARLAGIRYLLGFYNTWRKSQH